MSQFSEIQNDKSRLAQGIYHATRLQGLLFFPIWAAMAALAKPLLTLVYTSEVGQAYHVFVIICYNTMFYVLGLGLVTLFYATGRPAVSRTASFVRLVALLIFIVPFVRAWQINGAALAGLISSAVWVIYDLYIVRKKYGMAILPYLYALAPGIVISAILFFSIRLVVGF